MVEYCANLIERDGQIVRVKALNSSVMEAVLSESRALVVVTSTSIDAIQKTRTTLEWLSNNGYRKLIGSTVLAVNHVERTKLSTLAAAELDQLISFYKSDSMQEALKKSAESTDGEISEDLCRFRPGSAK